MDTCCVLGIHTTESGLSFTGRVTEESPEHSKSELQKICYYCTPRLLKSYFQSHLQKYCLKAEIEIQRWSFSRRSYLRNFTELVPRLGKSFKWKVALLWLFGSNSGCSHQVSSDNLVLVFVVVSKQTQVIIRLSAFPRSYPYKITKMELFINQLSVDI